MDITNVSDQSKAVYKVVGMMPFCTGANVSLVLDIERPEVANVLRRGELGSRGRRKASQTGTSNDEVGLLFSVKMGRVRKAKLRYAYSHSGVRQGERELGVEPQWFNSQAGLRALAGRLPLLEVAYEAMPRLFQLNTVVDTQVRLIGPEGNLVNRDWTFSRMTGFWWLRSGPFAAIAKYEHSLYPGSQVFVPVMWFGPFHTARHISHARSRLLSLLDMPVDWSNIGFITHGDWRPGVMVIVPEPVSGVKVRQLMAELRLDLAACILDVQGRVLQPMENATFPWTGWRDPDGDGPTGLPSRFRLGIPHEIKPELEEKEGAFAALNGAPKWRLFYESIVPMPGLPIKELHKTSGVSEPRVSKMVANMTDANVVAERDGGIYTAEKGQSELARVEGVRESLVRERLAIFLDDTSTYSAEQRPHTIKVAETVVAIRANQLLAYPVLGATVKRYRDPRRVMPDAFLVLPSGLVEAVEYEQSARSPSSAGNKLANYDALVARGIKVPVMIVTPTLKAAENFVRVRMAHVLATPLDKLISGPYGSAELDDQGHVGGDPGVFGYWFKGHEGPTFTAPVDMWDKLQPYPEWRISLVPLGVGDWKRLEEERDLLEELNADYYADIYQQLLQAGQV